jgi:GMP synthase PP-ATPase subunit
LHHNHILLIASQEKNMNTMPQEKVLRRANEIVSNHNLKAEILPGVQAVGVQGDNRVYLPVMVLMGPHPGWDILGQLSTQITNELPVSHVVYDATPGHGFTDKTQPVKQGEKKKRPERKV